MTTRQPETLQLANILRGINARSRFANESLSSASAALENQYARITELESQLAQRFDAADMATAAAQGFRDGATAPAQPVAAPATRQGVAYAALPDLSDADGEIWRAIIYWGHAKRGEDALRKASELERVLSDQMRAFADATHALRASHGLAPAKPDPAYSAACHLATALFKKYFAHLPDFASGQAVWSLCDSTAGVISQIDNMVSGLVQPPTTAFSEDEL